MTLNSVPFKYFYPPPQGEPRVKPKCCLNSAGCLSNANVSEEMGVPGACSNYDGCISDVLWLSGCSVPPDDPPSDDDPPSSCCNRSCFQRFDPAIQQLSDLLEQGKDEGLFVSLRHRPASESTYQALVDASPYLSDELLLAILQSELPQEKKASLMLRNAPLSNEVFEESKNFYLRWPLTSCFQYLKSKVFLKGT